MKLLRRALFVVGAAVLLWMVHLTPASAATSPATNLGAGLGSGSETSSGAVVTAVIPWLCDGGVFLPEVVDNGQSVRVTAGIGCSTNVDYLQVNVQLRRIANGGDSLLQSNWCSEVWTAQLLCTTGAAACQPGLYYGVANLQAATFNDNSSVTRSSQLVSISC